MPRCPVNNYADGCSRQYSLTLKKARNIHRVIPQILVADRSASFNDRDITKGLSLIHMRPKEPVYRRS